MIDNRRTKAMDDIKKQLYDVMSHDIGVMSEHGDSDIDLWNEIESADNEIINAYIDTYLRED
jgi:hypothetical protein